MVTNDKRSGVCIVATALGAQEPSDVAGALRDMPWEAHVDYRTSDRVTRLLQQRESFQAFLSLSITASFPQREFHKERSPQQETGPCSARVGVFQGSRMPSLPVVNTKSGGVEMCFS
jgi:hypothetical protein